MTDKLLGSLQENTLCLVCTDDVYCQLVRNSIPVELFSTILYRDIVARVYAYIDEFKKAPGAHLPDLVEDLLKEKGERAEAVRRLLENIADLATELNPKYVAGQLEKFNRLQSLKLGSIEMMKAIQDGDLDRAENVIMQAIKQRLTLFEKGSTLDDIYKGLLFREEDTDRVTLGIPELDRYGFGPGRGELWEIVAPTGRGKSWMLGHIIKRALMQRWRVLAVTLEMSEKKYGRRILQSLYSFTKRSSDEFSYPYFEVDKEGRLLDVYLKVASRPALDDLKEVKKMGRKLKELRQRGNLIIKQFPTGQLTLSAFRAYLGALEQQDGFMPDLICFDYPKLMALDASNLRLELGQAVEGLRGIAVELDCSMAIGMQSNRMGGDAKELRESHVAEDISQVHTADVCIMYSQTEAEKDLQLARLQVAKGRDDKDGMRVLIAQAYAAGQFVLSSRPLDRDYWVFIESKKSVSSRGSDEGEEAS